MSLTESLLISDPRRFGLWPSVAKLLRLRVRIWWNGLKRSKLRNKIGMGFLLLLLVGGMVALFLASSWLLSFVQSPQLAQYVDPSAFLNAIPTIVLTAAFFLTMMTNFGVLLQALYLSHDMDFLVTSPLPMRAVFLAKLLEAVLPNFGLFCAFSLPVLFGLGTASGYSLLFYPLLVVMLALLALAAAGLAGILVMAVVRVVPAKRVAEVLGVLGAMASILCGQSGNIINAMGVKQADVGGALSMFTRLNTPWSPLSWAGTGLLSVGRGEWLPGLGLSFVSLALAGGLFAGALFLAERLYYTGWSSMQGNIRKKRAVKTTAAAKPLDDARSAALPTVDPSGAVTAGAGVAVLSTSTAVKAVSRPSLAARLIPAQVRAMIVKDFLVLRRDPRNFSQLLTPLIVGFVMLFSTRRGTDAAGEALSDMRLSNLDVYGVIMLSIFVGWMLLIGMSTLAFTREGKNYWMLKAAPIRPLNLMVSKYIVSVLPPMAFCLVYLVVAHVVRGMAWNMLPFAALVVLASVAGATGIGLSFGTAGANLEWDSPQRQRLRGSAGCLVFIAISVFTFIDAALFVAPVILWQLFGNGASLLPAYALGIVLGVGAAVAAVVIPLMLVMPKMARIGEPE